MPLPERDASSYRPRARRQYRRFRIKRPVEPAQPPWEFSARQVDRHGENEKPRTEPSGYLWLLLVLAIVVFTFVCLIALIVSARWLIAGP